MNKKGWFFTILSVLFGGMVASPGPGGAALRGQLGRVGGNLWGRLQQAGQDITQALGNAGGAIRSRIYRFMARLRMIMYVIVISWIAIIGAALLPHQWAQNVVPAVMLVSLVVLGWLFMVGFSIGAILVGAAKVITAGRIIGRYKPGISSFIDEFEKVAKQILRDLKIFVGIQLLLGIYLAIVPVSNDRSLLLLLAVAFAATACFVGVSGKVVKGLSVLIAIITLIFFLGGRNNAAAEVEKRANQAKDGIKSLVGVSTSAAPPSIAAVRADRECRDDKGQPKKADYESFARTNFDQSFDAGCGTLMVMPRLWGYHLHMQPAADNPARKMYFYVKEPGGQYRGPIELGSDTDMHLMSAVPVTFFIQPAAGQSDFKVNFWTDLVLPAEPETPAPAAETKAPTSEVEPASEETPVSQTAPRKTCSGNKEGISNPTITKKVYPDAASRGNFVGTVPVNLVVDKDGYPTEIDLPSPTGIGRLDDAIIDAVNEWRWRPATKDGSPVAMCATISMDFHRDH